MRLRVYGLVALALIALIIAAPTIVQAQGEKRVLLVGYPPVLWKQGVAPLLVEGFEDVVGDAVEIRVTSIKPSGDLLRALADGSICVAITASPVLEREYALKGLIEWRGPFSYIPYIIAGPPDDPAGVRNADSVIDAFRRMYEAGEKGLIRVVSPGELSAAHVRERQIWNITGLDPQGREWYYQSLQDPVKTAIIAADMNAYVFIDHDTYATLKAEGRVGKLEILYMGDESEPLMLHVYSLVTSGHPSCDNVRDLILLFEAYVKGPGQEALARYVVERGLVLRPVMNIDVIRAWKSLAGGDIMGNSSTSPVSSFKVLREESLLDITSRSIYISGVAAFMAFVLGLFISIFMLRLKRNTANVILGVADALVGVPATALALFIYMLIYPQGPLGPLGLLYTPNAIILGQSILVLPLSITYLYRILSENESRIKELVLSLSGPEYKAYILLLRETPPALIAVYLIAFARAIGELGLALILGGGIQGLTNVITTAIALRVAIGEYEMALQLGLVLVTITVIISQGLRLVGSIIWR